jgi:hypothetical protein
MNNTHRGATVIELARHNVKPARDAETIMREAMRLVDERHPSPRSWLQRLGDRMEASELVEAVVCSAAVVGCFVLMMGGLWLLQRQGWLW